ncbi:MAG: hypothetical protein QXW00_02485 [Candidatus Woesearchaeota archaeon]
MDLKYESLCKISLASSLLGIVLLFLMLQNAPSSAFPQQESPQMRFRSNFTVTSVIPKRDYFLVGLYGCSSVQARFYGEKIELLPNQSISALLENRGSYLLLLGWEKN